MLIIIIFILIIFSPSITDLDISSASSSRSSLSDSGSSSGGSPSFSLFLALIFLILSAMSFFLLSAFLSFKILMASVSSWSFFKVFCSWLLLFPFLSEQIHSHVSTQKVRFLLSHSLSCFLLLVLIPDYIFILLLKVLEIFFHAASGSTQSICVFNPFFSWTRCRIVKISEVIFIFLILIS